MIPFNIPFITGRERKYLNAVIKSRKLSGDGGYTKKCQNWMESAMGAPKVMLTGSCTQALEMAALLADIKPGDEVIMPSFTFVSTANAFVLRGATAVFVDIRPDTMNIDENLIEAAITSKTRAIVPVHYAGVACEMDAIADIAKKHNLFIIEDLAQGFLSKYRGNFAGTMGHFGCISFHDTKNCGCGEGGAILVRDEEFHEKADCVREKGTNRSKFISGFVNKYTWVDIGSSFLMSELNAAFLYAQLENSWLINKKRNDLWKLYFEMLKPLSDKGSIELPSVPAHCETNGHIFYIKAADTDVRTDLIKILKKQGIQAVFHYIPLHSSPAGMKYGRFSGEDKWTTRESGRLLRLPLYFDLSASDAGKVAEAVIKYYS